MVQQMLNMNIAMTLICESLWRGSFLEERSSIA